MKTSDESFPLEANKDLKIAAYTEIRESLLFASQTKVLFCHNKQNLFIAGAKVLTTKYSQNWDRL